MTELIIDGIQAVLPQSFTIQVKRENPLITKNGEYTYDVTLDLSNPINADLYKHLNRLNSVAEVKTKRSAVLIADNRVYCNGTEVITGWTDKAVTIQIASGNSELNYIIGGEQLISALNMRDTPVSDIDFHDYITKTYPEIDFCLAPLYNRTADVVINRYAFDTDSGIPVIKKEGSDFYPQPFLCAFIKDMLKALGYSLSFNFLDNTSYKCLYLCNGKNSTKWNEFFPKWTVLDFLQEIENIFNAIFVINSRTKEVKLLSRVAYYQGAKSVHVSDIEDDYEVDMDDEPDLFQQAKSNLSYKFPDNEYWRERCLSDLILSRARRETIPKGYDSILGLLSTRLYNWFSKEEHKRKDTIYTDEEAGREFVYYVEVANPYRMINDFPQLKREEPHGDIEFNIIPAELAKIEFSQYKGGAKSGYYIYRVPVVDVDWTQQSAEVVDVDINEMIKNGSTLQEDQQVGLSLALYMGMYMHSADYPDFPTSQTDEYIVSAYGDIIFGPQRVSLRLDALDDNFYKGAYDISFDKAYKIKSYDPNVYNPRQVFEIRNKRYICAEIEYTLDANGRKGAWTGTFYPIRISDTEADARWILTDGKWRDGGVWLDNGRWLDE